VADRAAAYSYRMWGFGEGAALLGILRTGEALSRRDLIDKVADLVVPTLAQGPQPTDHLIAVEVLHELTRLRPAIDVRPLVERFVHAIMGAPRPLAGRPQVHRPDLCGLSSTVWVDCLHTDVPGLMLAGECAASVAVAEEACAALQDESGLFSHGFDINTGQANDVHWGRGQGWAMHGLSWGRRCQALDARLNRLVRALLRFEEDGAWHTVVDNPNSPRENSVSALVASGLFVASRIRPTDRTWLSLAGRALSRAIGALDAHAGLPVSAATPVGNEGVYLEREIGTFPWGQGPLLLALLELKKGPRNED